MPPLWREAPEVQREMPRARQPLQVVPAEPLATYISSEPAQWLCFWLRLLRAHSQLGLQSLVRRLGFHRHSLLSKSWLKHTLHTN